MNRRHSARSVRPRRRQFLPIVESCLYALAHLIKLIKIDSLMAKNQNQIIRWISK